MVRRQDIVRLGNVLVENARWEGPSMILLLFATALLSGVLAGLAARSLQSGYPVLPMLRHEGASLPSEAYDLGYRTEQAFAADRRLAAEALDAVLQDGPGAQRLWENAETGNRGVIWAAAAERRQDGMLCRSLARRTLINNAFRSAQAEACRVRTDQWERNVIWTIE